MEGVYEGEVSRCLGVLRDHLHGDEEAVIDFEAVDKVFAQFEQALKQLETEARTQSDTNSRKALMAKAKQFRNDVKKYQSKAKELKKQQDRDELMPWGRDAAQQDRYDAMEEKSKRSTETLKNSAKVMLEIEETAQGVSDQLSQNRATIMSTKRKLDETQSMTGTARQILKRMEQNERLKKLFAYGAIAIVAVALLYLFLKLFF